MPGKTTLMSTEPKETASAETGDEDPSALLFWRQLPVYQEYEKGAFLQIQAVIEIFFPQSKRFARSLNDIAVSLDESGNFDEVELKIETINKTTKRAFVSLLKGSIAVILTDSTIRATKSGNDMRGSAPDSSFDELKEVLQFSIDKVKAALRDKTLQANFLKPRIKRIGTKIDYVTKLDQPRVRGLDKRKFLNSTWLAGFSDSDDKVVSFSLALRPDYAENEEAGVDTTISLDIVQGVEVELQLGLAKVDLTLGPVARLSVIRGYLGESGVNLERIDDTHEFVRDQVLSMFSEEAKCSQ